jgi:type IV secretory pathway VirB2 component (pilin)
MRTTRSLRVAIAAVLAAAVAATTLAFFAPDAGALSAPVSKALKYLHGRQTKAGGFSVSGSSAAEMTPWVMMAIARAGQNPATWKKPGGRTPVQYLQSIDLEKLARSQSGSAANVPNFYAKAILGYKAARQPSLVRRAGSKRIDLVAKLLAYQDSSGKFTTAADGNGNYASISTTTYAILALKASGRASAQRAKAVAWLRGQAAPSGGFSYMPGGPIDVDSTAAAIQALIAGGVSRGAAVIKDGLGYIKGRQQASGGFTYAMGGGPNVESSAQAAEAVIAAGQKPGGSAWRTGGRSALDYIRSKQASSGLFYHLGTTVATPLLTTAQAIIALQTKTMIF